MKKEQEGIYNEATELLKKAQRIAKESAVGQEEAEVFLQPDYPSLPIVILFATDIHYGSIKTHYDLLERHLQTVEETPNMYMVSNGDEVDNFNAILFPSGMMENPLPPQVQTMAIVERLKKLAEKGKLLALSFGNHNEFMDASGYSWIETFARDLRVPVFTSGGLLRVSFGQQSYEIAMTHTYWGRSKLNPTNANKRFLDFEYPNADIVFLGHTHQSESLHFEKGRKDRIAIVGGTYKLEKDHWAARRGIGMRSGKPGHLVFLYPTDHRMVAVKDFDAGVSFLRALQFQEDAKQGVTLYQRKKKR